MVKKISLGLLVIAVITCSSCNHKKNDYWDANLPVEQRVEDLLSKMTLEEKVAQLYAQNIRNLTLAEEGIKVKTVALNQAISKGIGAIENTFDPLSPEESVRRTNRIQQFLRDSTRLKIPALIHSECLHGHAGYNSTVFPTPLALACSWNPELIEKAFLVTGIEARARGSHEAHTPVLDVGRDPRWGRIEETYGEDTYLVTQMGMAAITGLQGGTSGNPGRDHIISACKHFAGYAQVDGGRNFAPTNHSPKILFDEILPPFQAAITKAQAQGIMASHGEIDGIPAHGNEWLLTKLLRDQWNFEGMVVCDYNDVKRLEEFHHVAATPEEAAVMALKAGVDMDIPVGSAYQFLLNYTTENPDFIYYIDRSVRRILRLKFMLALFENPFTDENRATQFVGSDENRQLAKKVADESIVLLKNENNLLPLNIEKLKSIAVIGPNADSKDMGVYSMKNDHVVSILEGIKRQVGNNLIINYEKGCEIAKEFINEAGTKIVEERNFDEEKNNIHRAVQAASQSDVAIVCVGGNVFTSVEATYGKGSTGDRHDLELLGNQEELVRRIAQTGTPVVLVLMGGKPYAIPELVGSVQSIISTFYLGQANGRSVADALFGKVNPSGKLAISFPRAAGQLPIYYSQKSTGFFKNYIQMETSPLFPFGFGLSYTTFEFSNFKIDSKSIKSTDKLKFSFQVKNSGSVAGAEVAQVYFRDEVASVTRPVKLLVRFEKVFLQPGETTQLEFEIDPQTDLSFTGVDMNRIVEPGKFSLMIGNSSDNILLRDEFELFSENQEYNKD